MTTTKKELDDAFSMLGCHLADAITGYADRKRAEELLIDLRIAVNGRIAEVRVEEIQARNRWIDGWSKAIDASPAVEANPVESSLMEHVSVARAALAANGVALDAAAWLADEED